MPTSWSHIQGVHSLALEILYHRRSAVLEHTLAFHQVLLIRCSLRELCFSALYTGFTSVSSHTQSLSEHNGPEATLYRMHKYVGKQSIKALQLQAVH